MDQRTLAHGPRLEPDPPTHTIGNSLESSGTRTTFVTWNLLLTSPTRENPFTTLDSSHKATPIQSISSHRRSTLLRQSSSSLLHPDSGEMRTAIALFFLLLSAALPLGTDGSLLPFFNRQSNNNNNPVAERFPDPFRILEHIPFALERDELLLSPARVDWKETADSHVISIEVPGLKREEVKIEVDENRILRVSGERKREEERKDEHWHYSERAYGKFWRQFRLPEDADLDSVSAKLEDGVLTVCMKKLSPDKIKRPRVVSIAGEGGQPKLTAAAGGSGTKEDL